MFKKIIIIIPFIIALFLYLAQEIRTYLFDSKIKHHIEEALQRTNQDQQNVSAIGNYVQILRGGNKFTEQQVQHHFQHRSRKEMTAGVAYWSFQNNPPVIASAFGTDYLHHFVNHYLVGYAPFRTQNLWMPHYTISMRLKYQLDAQQYGGFKEVWQNSKEAFMNTRGDCEDHALALADWLIEMGIDARVVLGDYKNEGHAWVVVFLEREIFLLESTSKQKNQSWRHYPLAKFETNYHPKYMFNRNYFWLNAGSSYTTRYEGNNWVKKSRFFRGASKPEG
jgi:predicted transglutaminase-like cysteine proteinase